MSHWFLHLKHLLGLDSIGLAKPWYAHRYVVIDLELTGLNPQQHEIVSLAWVVIEQQRVKVTQSGYVINSEVTQLAQSPIFHGITEEHISNHGKPLDSALTQLQQVCENSVVVFHNSLLDLRFLQNACKTRGQRFRYPVLDTLKIEQRRLLRQGYEIANDALTLGACLERYGIAHNSQHNALDDALATAQLLLAQCAHMCQKQAIKLADLISAR